MAHILKSRIGETSTTTGTGALTLAGAIAAHRAFSAVCANSDTTEYVLLASDGTWEAGIGTYSGTNTLTRTTVKDNSSGGTSAITLPAGTHTVLLSPVADSIGIGRDNIATLTNKTLVTPDIGTPSAGALTNCTADGTNAVGFKTVPQITKVADGAPTTGADLTYAGKHIYHTSTAGTFTIPANSSIAYPVGTALTFSNGDTAGNLTIAITTDTMRLAGAGTTGSRTLAANGIATALKVSSTEWLISGTGLT